MPHSFCVCPSVQGEQYHWSQFRIMAVYVPCFGHMLKSLSGWFMIAIQCSKHSRIVFISSVNMLVWENEEHRDAVLRSVCWHVYSYVIAGVCEYCTCVCRSLFRFGFHHNLIPPSICSQSRVGEEKRGEAGAYTLHRCDSSLFVRSNSLSSPPLFLSPFLSSSTSCSYSPDPSPPFPSASLLLSSSHTGGMELRFL